MRMDQNWESRSKERKARMGKSRNPNTTMLDDWEVSTPLIRKTKNTNKSLRMRGESWKCTWTLPCRAKKETKSSSSSRATRARLEASNEVPKTKYSCIVEAHESTRQRVEPSRPKSHEDHIAGKGQNSMTHYNLTHKFIPMPQAMKIPDAKAAVDKKWKTSNGKSSKRFQHGSWTKSKARRRLFWRHRKTKTKSTLLHWRTYVISKMRSWNRNITKKTKVESHFEETLWRTTPEPA